MKNQPSTSSSLLDNLSDAQLEAVQWKDGAMLLLAGPGSGKTRVLTTRIAKLLIESKDQYFKILALTFTNRAADEMRNRIELAAEELTSRVYIGTFHSFCADILRQHGNAIGIKSDFTIYTSSSDRHELLKEAILKYLKPSVLEDLGDLKILPLIDRLCNRLALPEDSAQLFRDKDLGALVCDVYSVYEKHLIETNAQDYGSLFINTYKLFLHNPHIAKRIRKTYRYWNIDEFQDTNIGQYKLINALANHDFTNIFVVADDDQIIYQWNGASHERVNQFIEDYNPHIDQLPKNYRCPPQIVELANNLIRNNLLRDSNKLPTEAGKTSGGSNAVTLHKFNDEFSEAQFVATDILKLDKNEFSEVVVLARTRYLLEKAQSALSDLNIKSRIAQRLDDFQSLQYVWLHNCLKQCNNRTDTKYIESVVGPFNQMTNISITTDDVISEAKSTEGDLLRTWARQVIEGQHSDEVLQIAKCVQEHLIDSLNYRNFITCSQEWFQSIFDSDEKEEVPSPYSEDKRSWRNLERDIRSAIGAGATLQTFLQELDLRSKEPSPAHGEIKLMTIHASKGNEFEHVYLMGLAEDMLPSFQSIKKGNDSPEMEEERRNCFVAITRTISKLTLTYASTYRNWGKQPSRFLKEMGLL